MTDQLDSELTILTDSELSWLMQEVSRATATLHILLGSLTEEESKRIRANVVRRGLATLRKERE